MWEDDIPVGMAGLSVVSHNVLNSHCGGEELCRAQVWSIVWEGGSRSGGRGVWECVWAVTEEKEEDGENKTLRMAGSLPGSQKV